MNAVEMPRWDSRPGDVQRCIAAIDNWAGALRDSRIVRHFSTDVDAVLHAVEGAELLDALEVFASTEWDFRAGRERNLAESRALTPSQVGAVRSVAAVLGLDGTAEPTRKRYDAILMTGGMVRAGIVKPRFLRELHDRGLEWDEGVFLGGFRGFAGDEVEVGRVLGIRGANEFDAMSAGMRMSFGLDEPDAVNPPDAPVPSEAGNGDWREERWSWRGHTLSVLAAPSSVPALRRANTVDTFRFWASRERGIRSVLVITTPVYVPYQAAGAVEVLGLECGISVETVAVSGAASDLGTTTQVFLPQNYFQEIRSAIHGMRSLRSALVREL